jgi:Na+/melibiose symporter-like transporter
MPSELNDPRNAWQNQPTEVFKMSADQLRRKAQQRQSRARFHALVAIVIGLVLCIFFALTLATAHELFLRMGFGLLTLWCLYFAYQAYKWTWPSRLEPDATLSTTLESYRSELEKQRDYVRHIWRRAGLTFCFLGMALIIVPELIKSLGAPRLALNVLPVCVLLAIWTAIFFPLRKRRQRKLQQEIEELRLLENGRQGSENQV